APVCLGHIAEMPSFKQREAKRATMDSTKTTTPIPVQWTRVDLSARRSRTAATAKSKTLMSSVTMARTTATRSTTVAPPSVSTVRTVAMARRTVKKSVTTAEATWRIHRTAKHVVTTVSRRRIVATAYAMARSNAT